MRWALVVSLAVLTACGASAPAAAPGPRVVEAAAARDLATGESEVTMEITELMCSPCAAQIVRESRALPGVTRVDMHLATKVLTVRFDTGVTARDRVVAAVEQIVAGVQ